MTYVKEIKKLRAEIRELTEDLHKPGTTKAKVILINKIRKKQEELEKFQGGRNAAG